MYFGDWKGFFYAVDSATGKEVWKLEAGKGVAGPPSIIDGTVLWGSRAGNFFALDAKTHPHALEGDVKEAAETITRCKGPGTWLFGGETTVQIKGTGLGGRNQELALRVALEAESKGWDSKWAFLSGGTDGRDGPTDAAGGLVDGGTLARMRAAGIDPVQVLENNDSYHALKAAGDLERDAGCSDQLHHGRHGAADLGWPGVAGRGQRRPLDATAGGCVCCRRRPGSYQH